MTESFNLYEKTQRLSKATVLKEDLIGNLQSYYMNQCYVFDKIPEVNCDFGMLVDFMDRTPERLCFRTANTDLFYI